MVFRDIIRRVFRSVPALLIFIVCVLMATVRILSYPGTTTRDQPRNLQNLQDFRGPCNATGFMAETRDQQKELTSSQLAMLNGCRNILYLRMPKCGSRGVRDVFTVLSERYNFETNDPLDRELSHDLSSVLEKRKPSQKPIVFTVHQRFRQYDTFFTANEPVMLNVIRDPIEHLISAYSYHKYGSKVQDFGAAPKKPPKLYHRSLDQCLAEEGFKAPCIEVLYTAIRYLTNIEGLHKLKTTEALQRAKHNLESHYLVVGTTEDLPHFFEVLETFLPGLFFNATQVYQERHLQAIENWKTIKREVPSNASLQLMRDHLTNDYHLYHFARARLYGQLLKVRQYKAAQQIGLL